MAEIAEENEFLEEITVLKSMFGDTVSEAVISAVIESCNGNVNLAADSIMNIITNDPTDDDAEKEISESKLVTGPDKSEAIPTVPYTNQNNTVSANQSAISQSVDPLSVSFADTFRNTGAVPKVPNPSPHSKVSRSRYNTNVWTDQVDRIVKYHNNGTRILILMRGVPGSGKSYLSRYITDITVGASSQNYATHIFSTDNYFMRGGVYQFNKNFLDMAHMTNQKKVCEATHIGLSPIIVDNTNVALWEMEPYARDGVRNGYIIEIVEPNTPWARNANQLTRRNIHNVPRDTIRRMLDNYQNNITTEVILKSLRLSYPMYMRPPVKRNIPAIPFPTSSFKPPLDERENVKVPTLHKVEYETNDSFSASSASKVEILHLQSPDSPDDQLSDTTASAKPEARGKTSKDDILNPANELKQQTIIDIQKQLELFEKVEKEWENGESWDDAATNVIQVSQNLPSILEPKPPRTVESSDTEKLIEPANICDDWTKITMFMPSWEDDTATNSAVVAEPPIETNAASTSIEIGDLDNGVNKILYAKPRNINENILEKHSQMQIVKMPMEIMLDKSTTTHEYDICAETQECKNKEHHFRAFRKMFKIVPRHILRDIFDSCCADVNWAVNIVLDSYPEAPLKNDNIDEVSDTEEEPIEECHCLAAYNIIPDVVSTPMISPPLDINTQSSPPQTQKKPKRETKLSDSSLQLKRQLESNVVISSNHYSQHYLNTRRRRDNDSCNETAITLSPLPDAKTEDVGENIAAGLENLENNNAMAAAASIPQETASMLYNDIRDITMPCASQYNFQFMDPDSDAESDDKCENLGKLVSVNIGYDFCKKLDQLFGREGFVYPENIQPVVNIPMSILREMNAYWTESVAFQMDDGSKQSEEMIKQDEDFARQLADKEKQMSKEGKKPDLPSMKEIMDMELAYSIYERNVAEWRHHEPQDLAAKLSREKLYDLFPDISNDVLSEMLMAHEYNFKATVESLLISTGQADLLEEEKGVEKFVMTKELERKEKFLQEQEKNLSEEEWPFLSDPPKPITLDTVNYYRAEADKSLLYRNANFNKARQYFERNSPSAASFYSQIAALHTKKYEQSSALAAAYLMSYHLIKNPDKDVLDLHFLRVPEAMVNLDIFLDKMILKLRNQNVRSKAVFIITGRGQHSPGGPRIKPAAKRRLKSREIISKEINAGLLSGKLYATHKMTNELPRCDS